MLQGFKDSKVSVSCQDFWSQNKVSECIWTIVQTPSIQQSKCTTDRILGKMARPVKKQKKSEGEGKRHPWKPA